MSARGMAMASDAPTFLMGVLRVADVALVILTGAIGYWLRHNTWDVPVYMSATIADDSEIVRTFGASTLRAGA